MGYVGRDVPHDSAIGHVSGESVFVDDLPPQRNEVVVECFGSPIAHGRIKKLDFTAARMVPGIVAILTAADVPGHNEIGPVFKDEHLLAHDETVYIGDPIALIVGESRSAIRDARRAITLEIEELPPIFSIGDAIEQKSFIGPLRVIAHGDAAAAMKTAEHTLSGKLVIGGQEHFYLESQAVIVTPEEHRTFKVISSTQHPSEVQTIVAEVLGIGFNQVAVECKRMGGGFGGKETQAAQPACYAALAAYHTKRPARFVFTKDDDMRFTGKRHPFESHYTVGFDHAGHITALDVQLYSNGGCSCDLSLAVLERAMLHTDNAYFLPHVRVTGQVCKTHLPSNTAFRGFGGPQGIMSTENLIEEIAAYLKIDAATVRQANLYADLGNGPEESPMQPIRATTPYGQVVRNNTLPRLIKQLRAESQYDERRAAIAAFNQTSKTQLRGLALTPVKFGISFTKQHMNQANALVNIYTDGSVLVTTGGTEMGQGVNTRVRQIVADELGVELATVRIGATDTAKNNNTSPTAASSGTDLNGAAAADACVRLRQRLAAFAAGQFANNDAGLTPSPEDICFADGQVWDRRRLGHAMAFKDLVLAAYLNRINLGERGFYSTPGVDYNRDTGKGHPFLYFTNGAAVSEVTIDRFTGEARCVRADLLMDVGMPINPGLDRGQVIGAFIQGMGWLTTEELKYAPSGELWSYSPTTYKIPNISDVPEIFNCAFFDNPDNVVSLKRSKAVGEPPLVLGISVWAAIKNALSYVSGAQQATLSAPATCEEILMRLTALRPAPATLKATTTVALQPA
jgi:xanthine dehydrogenase large subunit